MGLVQIITKRWFFTMLAAMMYYSSTNAMHEQMRELRTARVGKPP